jgi:hypothetical protein
MDESGKWLFFCPMEGQPMPAIKRTAQVGVRVRPCEMGNLKAVAEARGETVSEMVRELLRPLMTQQPPVPTPVAAEPTEVGVSA